MVVLVLLIVFPGSAFFLGTVGFLFLRVKRFLHGNSCEGKRIYGVTEREACIFSGTVGFRNWSVDKVGWWPKLQYEQVSGRKPDIIIQRIFAMFFFPLLCMFSTACFFFRSVDIHLEAEACLVGPVGISWDAVSEWAFLNLGVEQLRDGSTESFWQSDGPQLLGTSRKIDELLGMVIWWWIPGSLIFQPLSWVLATFILSKDARPVSFFLASHRFSFGKQKSWGLISSTSSFNGRHRCYEDFFCVGVVHGGSRQVKVSEICLFVCFKVDEFGCHRQEGTKNLGSWWMLVWTLSSFWSGKKDVQIWLIL